MVCTRRVFIGGIAAAIAAPLGAHGTGPALELASEAPDGIDPAAWLVSEKYDGVRAVWDGRRLVFRSGRPVAAPSWFTARLPPVALDGELWLGRGGFEALMGCVRKAQPVDDEWRALRYMVFDRPGGAGRFTERAAQLAALVRVTAWPPLVAVEQSAIADRAALAQRLAAVVQGGGEGLVLHRADAHWRPGRSRALLKLKPQADAEAVVIGRVAGRGRHEGRLGALRVRDEQGHEFLLGTGFSDAQREAPPPAGSVVTFRHRGRTAGGLPRFASFLRVHEAL